MSNTPNPVVAYRKPEDVVGRGSKLLLGHAYKKNLRPRELVARIMMRPGIDNLQLLLKLYQSKIDGITVAAILSKVSETRLRAPKAKHETLDATIVDLLAWLDPFIRFQLRFCTVSTISAILWGWAGLPPQLRYHALPTDLAVLLLARACHPDKTGLVENHRLAKMAPRYLALLAWSSSRLIPEPVAHASPEVQAAAAMLAIYTQRREKEFSPQGLSLVAAGLVSLAPDTGRALLSDHLAGEAARRIGSVLERQFKPQELLRLLGACGQVGVQHVGLFEKAAAAALPQVHAWKGKDTVELAEVMAVAGVRHDALMAAIATAISRNGDWSHHAGRVLAACKKLGYSADELAGVLKQGPRKAT